MTSLNFQLIIFSVHNYKKHIAQDKIHKDLIHNLILEHYILLNLEINSKDINLVSIEECKAILLGSLIYKQQTSKYISLLKNII